MPTHASQSNACEDCNEGAMVQILIDVAGLARIEEEWESLFSACASPSCCALHAWVLAWWESFGKAVRKGRATPFIVLVRDAQGLLTAVFPLYETTIGPGPLGSRHLYSIGESRRVGVHDMTEEPTVLVRPGHEDEALRSLADLLHGHLRERRWDLVDLRLANTFCDTCVRRAFEGCGLSALVRVSEVPGSMVVSLPASWPEYRKILSKSMRDNLGYYPRLLVRDGHDWKVETYRDPPEVGVAISRLMDLHRSRGGQVRGRGHNDHLHTPTHRAFLADVCKRLAASGRAFVAELVVDGQPIASQVFYEVGDTLTVYYSGFLEPWYGYSPVFVIESMVFQRALAGGAKRLNFLKSFGDWVERWGAQRRPPSVRITIRLQGRGSRFRLAWFDLRRAGQRLGGSLRRTLRKPRRWLRRRALSPPPKRGSP